MHTMSKLWVKGRAACILPPIFEKLASVIQHDVEAAKAYSPFREEGYEFGMEPAKVTEKTRTLTVTRYPPPNSQHERVIVTFKCENLRILVTHSDTDMPTAWTVMWNANTGECDLLCDGQCPPESNSYALWQVSQRVLSPLFFPPNTDGQAFMSYNYGHEYAAHREASSHPALPCGRQ